jgi:hypothetical protein
MTNPPRPPVQPLTVGYIVKGGQNSGTSQIQTRPAAPAPIPSPPPAFEHSADGWTKWVKEAPTGTSAARLRKTRK